MALPSSGPLSINDIAGEFGGSTPHAMSEYYAGGGLVPAGTSGTYGAVPSSGTISIQNFYGTSNFVPVYIEEIFSTWLFTGNGSTQTITNGINLSANGGMVWLKERNAADSWHTLFDTNRGVNKIIFSNSSQAETTFSNSLTAFNASGFSLGSNTETNLSSEPYVSWTFRKQPKFFDVVTYTGTGSARTVAHNLGSVPGCIIIKRLNSTGEWQVFHRSTGNTKALFLNGNSPGDTAGQYWNNTSPTSTEFTVGFGPDANANGSTYVAYLFAHDAGGFGATGTDNVITCGTFTTNSIGDATVNLGYEPQWVLWKSSSNSSSWNIADNMRGFTASGPGGRILNPNNSNAEGNSSGQGINSTGFSLIGSNANWTWIYVAIRRGPMKTPTTGTSVYLPVTDSTAADTSTTTNFVVDMNFGWSNDFNNVNYVLADRLRGYASTAGSGAPLLRTNGTDAETTGYSPLWYNLWNTTVLKGNAYSGTSSTTSFFRRAPGFFDVVCYSGNGVVRTIAHNLKVVPELMIVKGRSGGATEWSVYVAPLGATDTLRLNEDGAASGRNTIFNATAPTASVFTVGTNSDSNNSSLVYVNYLFATCAGVSKVGSYTGTGALQTINCGFTSGARFILIKRTDTTGDWWYFNSAQGISSGNDPYILLNSTAKAVTGTNYVDTASTGFQVTAAAPAGMNANGGSYIFLAIA